MTSDERKYTLDLAKMRNKLQKSENEGDLMLPVEVFDIFFASFQQKSGTVSYSQFNDLIQDAENQLIQMGGSRVVRDLDTTSSSSQ